MTTRLSMLLLCLALFMGAAAFAPSNATAPLDYQPVKNWPTLPADFKLGGVSAVATDSADRVYLFHRGKNPIVVLDKDGKYLRSWGEGLIHTAHGLRVDPDNNIWITDIGNHLVMKFNAEGKLLLTLGTKDKPGATRDTFNKPTDMAVAPSGDVYVSDGYGNSRVVKFTKEGKYIREWGTKGKGEGEFNLPHAICLDAKGQVYVGDRENDRVQVFDPDGKFITQWKESGAPFGLFLTKEAKMFVADGRGNVVRLLDGQGKEVARFGEKGASAGQFTMPHWICVDRQGAVYVAEVSGERAQKFVAK